MVSFKFLEEKGEGMRKLILVAAFAFAGATTCLQAGFQVGAGALFGGKTKVSLSGLTSAHGGTANQDFEVDNDVGFYIGGSYVHDFSEKFAGTLGLSYSSQKTTGKINAAKYTAGTFVSNDNNTATTKAFDLRAGVQFKVIKDLNVSVALTFPVWAELKGDGTIDNLTGADTYELDGSLGVDLNVAYMFTKNFSANLGYSFLNTQDGDHNGGNNKNISVASSVGRFVFGVAYTF